jgi:hypothetical protein
MKSNPGNQGGFLMEKPIIFSNKRRLVLKRRNAGGMSVTKTWKIDQTSQDGREIRRERVALRAKGENGLNELRVKPKFLKVFIKRMNQSLVMDSDECWCSSTGRLKETNQERKKLPNAEVVQIK